MWPAADAVYLRGERDRVTGRLVPVGPYAGRAVRDVPTAVLRALLRFARLAPPQTATVAGELRRRADTDRAARSARRAELDRRLGL
jgi:hypothetical protein